MKEKTIFRNYCLDGDELTVKFNYDKRSGVYLGEYPYFHEEPRYTPSGRPWIDVTKDDCPYATDSTFHDCSTCLYMRRERDKDLIGICMNENLRINGGNEK